MTDEVLRSDEAKVWFGGVRAVDGVSLSLRRGKLYGLVGPNGSGKTTLLNAISGLAPLTAGHIRFLGRDLTALKPHEVGRAGIARTFQGVRLVPTLTVRQNIMLAADRLLIDDRAATDGRRRRSREHRRTVKEETDKVVGRLHLRAVADAHPTSLPYGVQRKVEIARALVSAPDLLLLDEPLAGMSHGERAEIAELFTHLRDEGLTQLIIEHDLRTLLEICDHLIVLNFGRCVASGTPRETAMHPGVQEAYLGTTNDGS